MNNKKVVIISSIILAVLVLTIGATYSIFSLSKVSKNSNLVVGDIYMHYNETTNAINITDMMPTSTIKVNTSADKVSKCVEYLKTTYGDTWNNLTLDGLPKVQSNKNNNTNIKPISYSLNEIASKIGFKKASSFTSQFKASTGMLPSKYREYSRKDY